MTPDATEPIDQQSAPVTHSPDEHVGDGQVTNPQHNNPCYAHLSPHASGWCISTLAAAAPRRRPVDTHAQDLVLLHAVLSGGSKSVHAVHETQPCEPTARKFSLKKHRLGTVSQRQASTRPHHVPL
jgi:hypothetical protein